MTPPTLPTGTRYHVNGVEFELLAPSVQRPDGTYPVPARRYQGEEHQAPTGAMADCQSLDLGEGVTLPELDPYAEHRRKIGDDK